MWTRKVTKKHLNFTKCVGVVVVIVTFSVTVGFGLIETECFRNTPINTNYSLYSIYILVLERERGVFSALLHYSWWNVIKYTKDMSIRIHAKLDAVIQAALSRFLWPIFTKIISLHICHFCTKNISLPLTSLYSLSLLLNSFLM